MIASRVDDVVRLDKSKAKHAVETLVKAFRNELPLKYYFPEAGTQDRISPYLMSMAVYPGIRYGEVHATPDIEGIAVWVHSDNFPISTWRLLRSAPLSAIIGFGRAGGDRMKGLGQYIDTVRKRQSPPKHMYLQALGVAPEFRGKGYAGRLLRYMLTRMDEAGLPCYLDTLEAKNVRMYEHFGFAVAEESAVPDTSLIVWAMLRNPTTPQKPLTEVQNV